MKAFLFVLAVVLSGCSKGGGSAAGPREFTASPENFKATGPASQNPIPNRFSVGCETPGSPQSKPTYVTDSRLHVGDVFAMTYEATSLANGYVRIGGTQTVTAVTSTSMTSRIQVTDRVNYPEIPATFTEACVRTDQDGSGAYHWECNLNKFSGPASLTDNNEDCSILGDQNGYTASEVPGTLLGRTAYWLTSKVTGEITCKGVSKGHGSFTTNLVVSNQLPAQGISYCGGSELFMGLEMKTDKNEVLQSYRSEVTQAPFVQE